MAVWSFTTLLLAFGGGVVGAALGGLWSIVICGFIVLAGNIIILAGGSSFLLLQVGMGPIFGPHVGGFAAGIAASAYAHYRGKQPVGTARDILNPLIGCGWDVLVMGGVFALFAHAVYQLVLQIPIINLTDPVSMAVFASGAAAQWIFVKDAPWGNKDSIKKYGWLKTDHRSISWAPWFTGHPTRLLMGLGGGLLSGAIAMGVSEQLNAMAASGIVTAGEAFVVPLLMGWDFAILSLILLNLGTGPLQKMPLWHAFCVLGALGYLLSGSLIVAAIVGVLASELQELIARMFWNHGRGHIDPPATTIAVGFIILNLLLKPEYLNLLQLFK